MENNMEFPWKIKNRTTMQSSSGHLSKENKNTNLKRQQLYTPIKKIKIKFF